MSAHRAIPPLLAPYLSLVDAAPSSLILLTSVLGASTNWLLLRYLVSANSAGVNVVLVSFLRDYAFWREGAKRLVSAGVGFSVEIWWSVEFIMGEVEVGLGWKDS